jgi:hypothetical protein
MITQILRGASQLDEYLKKTLGRPYHALLGIGLTVEIIHHVKDLLEQNDGATLWQIAAIVFFAALLINQLGELHDHVERRRRRSPSE